MLDRREATRGRGDFSPTDVVKPLAEFVLQMERAAPAGAYCVASGVAVAGMVRREDGMVRLGPTIGWVDEPLGDALAEVLEMDAPICVGNGADLGALAEHTRGCAIDSDNLIYLHGDVGVGGGIIAGGRPVTGHGGYGGEVGHMILVADGVTRPVIAVRILDSTGHPLHEGLAGEYSVPAPYEPARNVSGELQREFAGLERSRPTWRIEGDDGIAYIELAPTSVAGNATLGFQFRSGQQQSQQARPQQVQAWLKSAPRDWVVVGFAKGSLGYETLKDNMKALQPGEDGTGVRAAGQAALYAKGRVLGKWLLTLSYDSDKPTDRLRDQSLLSTIDPGQYYTLYGDGTQQGYDAASASKDFFM